MDNDDNIEEEELQKDIQQINQVLGDDDGEGVESDVELEIDEGEVDDGLTLSGTDGLEWSGNLPHESYPEDDLLDEHQGTGLGDPPLECSIEQLLTLNQESQINLQELLSRVQRELQRNREEQTRVSTNPSDQDQKNVDVSVRGLFRDYLEDGIGNSPPDNDETKQRKAANMPNPFQLPRTKWKRPQLEKLLVGVRDDGLKQKTQPLLNRQEVLEAKMDRLSLPKELEEVYEEIQEIKKQLKNVEKLPTSELLGDRFREADWDTIANVDLEGQRTAEECQLQWQNLSYPSINHKQWTEREKADLMKIAAQHECWDWLAIADELGTDRTALQCLSMFQELDKTFAKSTFTSEEDDLLLGLVQRLQVGKNFIPFAKVAYFMEGRTQTNITYRWMKKVNPSIKCGKWSKEEDYKLRKLIELHGARNWSRLAGKLPGRTQFQIRHRWSNTLAPNIKRGSWDYPETFEFLEKIQELGVGNWARIAQALKKPGEKERTPFHLLHRFKQVFRTYSLWKARNSSSASELCKEMPDKDINLEYEELYTGKDLPDIIAFLKNRQIEEEERKRQRAAAKAAQQSLDAKKTKRKKRKKRRQSSSEEDDDTDEGSDVQDSDDDDDDDANRDDIDNNDPLPQPQEPPRLTARQKVLALKREKTKQNAPTLTTRTQNVERKQRKRGRKRQKLHHENQEPVAETEHDARSEECAPNTSESNHVDEHDWTSGVEDDEDIDLSDARDDEDEDGEGTSSDARDTAAGTSPSRDLTHGSLNRLIPRGLSGWLKRIKARNAAIVANAATRSASQNAKLEPGPGRRTPDCQEKENSTFDIPSSVQLIHMRRKVGRRPLTGLDEKLVKAVDPKWLYQTRSTGRHTKHCLKAQERTRQEKLSRSEQKALFGLLLQVFDVDVGYTTALAKRSLKTQGKSKSKAGKQDSVQEEHPKEPEGLPGVTTAPEAETSHLQAASSCNQTVTTNPQKVTTVSQVITDSQKTTSGIQTVASCLQEVSSSNQIVASVPEEVTSVPQVTTTPQAVTSDQQRVSSMVQVTSAPQEVTFTQHAVTSCQQRVSSDNQIVTSGLKPVSTCQPGMARGNPIHAVTTIPQEVSTVPQGIPASVSQVVSSSLQGVITGTEAMSSGSQGVISPQALSSDPQVVYSCLQGVITCSQAVDSGSQGAVIGPQAMNRGLQGVNVGPQAVNSGLRRVGAGLQVVKSLPQGVVVRPPEVISGQQEVTNDVQRMTSGSQEVNANPQGALKDQQGVSNAQPRVIIAPPAVSSGLQDVTVEQVSHSKTPHSIPLPATSSVQQMTEAVVGSGLLQDARADNSTTACQQPSQQQGLVTGSSLSGNQQPQLNQQGANLSQNFNGNLSRSDTSVNITPNFQPRLGLMQNSSFAGRPLLSGAIQNQFNPTLAQHGNPGTISIPINQVSSSENNQRQYVLLRNNQTGQLFLLQKTVPGLTVNHQSQVSLLQSSVTATAPHLQTQHGVIQNSTIIPGQSAIQSQGGSNLVVPHGTPNPPFQQNCTEGSTFNSAGFLPTNPTGRAPALYHQQHLPQNSPAAAVQSSESPSISGPGHGQPPAPPVVINSTNPLAPGFQLAGIPTQGMKSYYILPQPVLRHQLGKIQALKQQVQPPVSSLSNQPLAFVCNTPVLPAQRPALHLSTQSVPEQVPQLGTQSTNAPSSSSSNVVPSQLVQLQLDNGSKVVLSMDQYRLYKAGGTITCNLLTPVSGAENKQKGPEQSQSATTQEQEEEQSSSKQKPAEPRLNIPQVNIDPPSVAVSCKRKVKVLKRKLHTKEIPLLPPNIATIQALTSLLFDRKTLESQRKRFISQFEQQFQKPQVHKEQAVSFRGYLESRNAVQRESSQPGKTSASFSGSNQECSHAQADDSFSLQINSELVNSSCSNSEESESLQQSSSSAQSVDQYLASLKKSDMYRVLQRRFLSLFLWPGLLSSTRIKGSLNPQGTSYYSEQPVVVKEKLKKTPISRTRNKQV